MLGIAASACSPICAPALAAFVAVVSMVPPLALLPILFITFGLDELSKVVLIVIGIAPCPRPRSARSGSLELPREQLIKAQTLGASTWQIMLRVVLPQLLPRLIDALRLSLGPAWLFLIAAEAIASRGRPRLPHLPGPALSGDGRHPALRRLDHAARLPDGLALRRLQRRAVPLV